MTDAEHRELWEERAAIREYDGGLTREEAEQMAYYDWRRLVGPKVKTPDWMRLVVRKFK